MLAAYDAGEAVTAGQVQVDAAAITLAGGSRLEWSNVRGLTLAHPSSASPDMTILITITAPTPGTARAASPTSSMALRASRTRSSSPTSSPTLPAQHDVPVYGQAS
jgi:hypothetical protein